MDYTIINYPFYDEKRDRIEMIIDTLGTIYRELCDHKCNCKDCFDIQVKMKHWSVRLHNIFSIPRRFKTVDTFINPKRNDYIDRNGFKDFKFPSLFVYDINWFNTIIESYNYHANRIVEEFPLITLKHYNFDEINHDSVRELIDFVNDNYDESNFSYIACSETFEVLTSISVYKYLHDDYIPLCNGKYVITINSDYKERLQELICVKEYNNSWYNEIRNMWLRGNNHDNYIVIDLLLYYAYNTRSLDEFKYIKSADTLVDQLNRYISNRYDSLKNISQYRL